jgi:3-deoxy-D-manno-octulosonic-acid transferase
VLVNVESELWPNLLHGAAERGVPVLIANATMSERSFRRRRLWQSLSSRAFAAITRVFAQDETAVRQFLALGVPDAAIGLAGNLKLARDDERSSERPLDDQREAMVTFGNIHPDEVARLMPAIRQILASRSEARIVLVPRHPAKFTAASVRALCGSDVVFATALAAVPASARLVWVNAIGVLSSLYRRSLIGVVCGTFNAVGGHDLAEPLQMGALAVYGPNIGRQQALHVALVAAGCSVQVAGPEELGDLVVRFLANPGSIDVRRAGFGGAVAAAQIALETVAGAVLDAASGHRPA